MTNYYNDQYQIYKGSNRLKDLYMRVKKNITIDLGGLSVGIIGLIFML